MPTDIAQLFAKDPLDLTKKDLGILIAELRTYRHQFELGNLKAGSTKPKTEKQKLVDDLTSKVTLDIKDLL